MQLKHLVGKKAAHQQRTLRPLSAEECRQVAAGALTTLGGNLNTTFSHHKTDGSTSQRRSLTRYARLIDY